MELTESVPAAPSGFEVFTWPEFRDFALRLGINLDLQTVRLTIDLQEQQVVVTHTHRPLAEPLNAAYQDRKKWD